VPAVWFGLALVAAFLTALYMFRLYFLAFSGEPRAEAGSLHKPGLSMTLPLVVLAAGSAVSGWLGIPGANVLETWLGPVFAPSADRFVDSGAHGIEYAVMAVSTLVALGGIGLAWRFYRGAGSGAPARIARAAPFVHGLLWDAWRVDRAYDCLVVRPLWALAGFLHRWLDAGLVDGVLVMGPGRVWSGLGSGLRRAVTGDVQAYAAVIVIALAALAAWVF
jgi:NADH-quinone oxidoreductase subunit L